MSNLTRGLWAWGSGVATMLIAVAVRDKGADVFELWYLTGAVGAVAMFTRAVMED